jgi:hypothetical protein
VKLFIVQESHRSVDVVGNEDEQDTDSADVSLNSSVNETSTAFSKSKGKKRKSNEDDLIKIAMKCLSDVNSLTKEQEESKAGVTLDEDERFGSHIAAEMKKIKDEITKQILKSEIQQLFLKAHTGQLQQSTSTSTSVAQQWQTLPNNYPSNTTQGLPMYRNYLPDPNSNTSMNYMTPFQQAMESHRRNAQLSGGMWPVGMFNRWNQSDFRQQPSTFYSQREGNNGSSTLSQADFRSETDIQEECLADSIGSAINSTN